ncbi:hypothetical protein COCCADRAFT_36006 [Bipolaris zeicola 26-R-13]|uniref:VHS domain-containing protein n=1 Tax=Cochliobolus carbonum (strain 26-R-13) TaxID=930089 RepID=W6YS49_COCC2|nr:uncharacterized protein COCCADRAFT_36006 [Bipolaris zeicola 26-R-13]EUC34346.1 hypothetical protein COCCADRAFT_36006 [Bipolaris zeicola 26-R-13]
MVPKVQRIDVEPLVAGQSPGRPSVTYRYYSCDPQALSSPKQSLPKSGKFKKHVFSAVTVQIDRLTSEQYEENDIGGVVDLIEVIRIQASGPTEAARALRKKLKYGNAHRQIRALVILDALIQNAGTRFQKTFADEPLLERLRILARDDTVDPDVRQKANVLFRGWAAEYKGKPGLERIAALHKELPRTKRPQPQQSRIVRQQDAEAAREREEHSESPPRNRWSEPSQSSPSRTIAPVAPGPSTSTSSSLFSRRDKKDKKTKRQPFNLEREKGQMLETIASANVASTNLLNGLQLINREQQRVSENAEVMRRFETCKQLRRQILRYIHLVESEQYIGGLLNANDELVKGLMAFEIMDKSIDDDSDSDNEAGNVSAAEAAMANMDMNEAPPPKPPRPTSIPMPTSPMANKQRIESDSEPEEDENDPFGDSNAIKTPFAERGQPTWRDV